MKRGILAVLHTRHRITVFSNCRKNILERMTYNSSSGSISSWVEKLQNIEAAIKATQENLKRRTNGLPPLPPPGLSHMQPKIENISSGVVPASTANPKGVNAVNKPIIGLGRGKRFSKQNSLPVGEAPITTVSAIHVGETSVIGSSSTQSSGALPQCQSWKPWSSSNSEISSQDEMPKKQQSASSSITFGQNYMQQPKNSEAFNQDQHKIRHLASSVVFSQDHLSSSSEIFNQNQPKIQSSVVSSQDQLPSSNDIFNQDHSKKQQQLASSSELLDHNQQLLSSSGIYGQDQPKKQHMASSSEVFGQNQLQLSSSIEMINQHQLPNNKKEQPQEQINNVAPKQTLRNADKTNDKSFTNLSLAANNAESFNPAVVTSTPIHLLPATQVSVPVSLRAMSYSSAVASHPPKKQLPPARPQQPFNRIPLMDQPPPLLPSPLQPHMYGQNHPQVVGLGRGNGPWSAAPPPHSWGGNGHYMHKMPPPVHFNFDHHRGPFYEMPSSGLHNPFYPIPPMGSSSGLDII